MNCEQTRQYLHDYNDGNLESLQEQVLEQHISGCDHCKRLLEQQSSLKAQLQKLPVVGPSVGFEQRIMAKLESVQGSVKTSGIVAKPSFLSPNWYASALGGAVTAFVLLWFVSFDNLTTEPMPSTISVVSIELIPNQIQKVSLAFNSPHEIDKATFKIILPANVEISGHKGKRELKWASKLKQGANRLAIPLIATKRITNANGDQFITARISHEGKSRDFKIKVISKAQQSGIQLDRISAQGITT